MAATPGTSRGTEAGLQAGSPCTTRLTWASASPPPGEGTTGAHGLTASPPRRPRGRGPRRPPRGSGPRSPATGASRCPASPRRSCAQAGLHHLDVLAVADEQARVVVAQVVEGHAGAEAGRRRGGAPDGGEPGPAHRWPGRRGEHQRGWLARPGEGTPLQCPLPQPGHSAGPKRPLRGGQRFLVGRTQTQDLADFQLERGKPTARRC